MKKNVNLCGKRLKEKRKALGLTQVEIAAALDIDHGILLDRSDISEIERGVRAVKDTELDALACILDVPLAWLVRGKE